MATRRIATQVAAVMIARRRIASEQSKTLEAVQRRACQITIGGGTYSSNCYSLKSGSFLTQQQTKSLFNQIVNIRNTAYITCYPLHENSLSLIVSDLPTNCRAY